jgi:hypothetical protein
VVREVGWSAASGVAWSVDHRAKTIFINSSATPPPERLVYSTPRTDEIDSYLQTGRGVLEGTESFAGVAARRIRTTGPIGELKILWYEVGTDRLVGTVVGDGFIMSREFLQRSPDLLKSFDVPTPAGYQRVGSAIPAAR